MEMSAARTLAKLQGRKAEVPIAPTLRATGAG
jgi:hypothetical protein